MAIMSVIKNEASGNMLCSKVPFEDFNIGSQLIVAEYEEALFMKNGVIEEIFGPGRYTLTTENYPFLTKLVSKLVTGGVNAYNCKIYYINQSHHLELKWGTGSPLRLIDPYWNIEVHVQARGAYTVTVKNGKKFFLKLVGADMEASEQAVIRNFRTAFIQNITDSLADYLASSSEEVLKTCRRKKALADALLEILNPILDEYGMELVNFYIESIEIPEDDACMERIRELRIRRQEKEFARQQELADENLRLNLKAKSADTDRYVSGQHAQADYERMHIRDQDGSNGWARQENAEILKSAVENGGMGGAMMGAGMGLGMGAAMGNMVNAMFSSSQPLKAPPSGEASTVICPNCNCAVPAEMKFCSECGAPMAPAKKFCPNCGAQALPGMKFCGECGAPLAPPKTLCPGCGAEVPAGMKFCGECGTRIG